MIKKHLISLFTVIVSQVSILNLAYAELQINELQSFTHEAFTRTNGVHKIDDIQVSRNYILTELYSEFSQSTPSESSAERGFYHTSFKLYVYAANDKIVTVNETCEINVKYGEISVITIDNCRSFNSFTKTFAIEKI